MGSGVSRTVTGAITGATAADVDVRTVGFRPSRVELYNETGNVKAVWQDSMPDGDMQKVIGSSGVVSQVTTTGITPLADGFRIGQDADLNVIAEKVHYVCYE